MFRQELLFWLSGNLERVGEMRNPGEFDARQYYASQHIFYFYEKGGIVKKNRKIILLIDKV